MDKKKLSLLPIAAFLTLAALVGVWVASPMAGFHFVYWAPVSVAGLCALAAIAHFVIPEIPIA